jgi:Ni,Fe-hydrogenase III small subunit/ferredoxin
MLEWLLRGLARGIVTTGYPDAPEPVSVGMRGQIELLRTDAAPADLEAVCPTAAIRVNGGHVTLDRGRCVLCGLCVASDPGRFAFASSSETATRSREALVVGETVPPEYELRPTLADRVSALRRSVHIRHVDAGSDGAEEWEIHALTNPYYDIQRLGIYFTTTPRHADVLLVTGGVTEPMREPLLRAWDAMPDPKAVIAAGTEACSGALGGGPGVASVLPVDVFVPGSPPTPIMLMHGLLLAIGVFSNHEVPA